MSLSRPTGADVVAGASVALLVIPQSLAYAGIAGVPAVVGLYAAAVPTAVAAIFASSPFLQTGPTAMTALLSFAAASSLAEPFSFEFVALTALFALLVGVIQGLVGLSRLGVVAYFISRPVLIGFTWGAVILIVASQIPTLFGLDRGTEGLLQEAFRALTSPSAWHTGSLAFGLGTIAVIEGARRFDTRIPGVLIAVAGGVVLSAATGFGGVTIGSIPEGFPTLFFNMPWSSATSLLIPALVISLVAFAEAAALSTSYATQDKAHWDPNREFVSQGASNITSGFFGGFLVGASFSRTSVNRLAGARTRWSGAVTGLIVLAFLPVVSVLEPLPSSVLAAVVIVAIVRLIDPADMRILAGGSRLQLGVAISTLLLTLVLSPHIDLAVIIGVAVGVLAQVGRGFRMTVTPVVASSTLVLEVEGTVFFGSTPKLLRTFRRAYQAYPEVDRLVVDLSSATRVVYTGGDALRVVSVHAIASGLDLEISGEPQGSEDVVRDVRESVGG